MTQPPDGYPREPGGRPPADHPHPPPPGREPTAGPGGPPTWPERPEDAPTWAGQPSGGGPGYGPPGGPGYGPPGPGYEGPGAPRRPRRGLLIVAIGLAAALVLAAGGGLAGWLLTRDPDRNGAGTPAAAVETFLEAVYRDLDPQAAAALVCAEARDEDSLRTKIEDIRAYQETEVDPAFSWSEPSVAEQREKVTVVTVTVTLTTGDEKTSDQRLRVSVLDKDRHGWWVCDVEAVPVQPPDGDGAPEGTPSGEPGQDGGGG